jgi:dihydrofolate reductase
MTRKVVLKQHLSLDGYAGRLDGDVSHIFDSLDDALTYWIVEDIWQAGVHIMGRKTYEDMAGWWPRSDEPFAAPMNTIPKAVFSDTLEEAPWGPVEIIRGDIGEGIAYLKSQKDGKPIYAHGGASFVRSLIAANLVDEYHLITHPVALGRGLGVFTAQPATRALRLIESRAFKSGAVLNIYQPVRE